MDGFPEWELRILEDEWEEFIRKQAKLSKHSELVFAKDSSHSIYLDRPEIIIDAIESLIK